MTGRVDELRISYVEFIPEELEEGVLYVSEEYETASHLCACGCGFKVVTSLGPAGWLLTDRHGRVTMRPSIGNWSLPCRAHYIIRKGRIHWAGDLDDAAIERGRERERHDRERHYDTRRQSWWRRALNWIMRLVRLR